MALDVLSKWPIPEYAHEKLQSLFNRYTLIGGMPAVVANYAQNNDLVSLNTEYHIELCGRYSTRSFRGKRTEFGLAWTGGRTYCRDF